MLSSRCSARQIVTTFLVLLLTACATSASHGNGASDVETPAQVVPRTSTEATGAPSTTFDATSTNPSPVPDNGAPLVGTIWNLESMNGRPPREGSSITLRFAPDGWLGGSDGCFYYSGEVAESPGALRVGNLVASLTGGHPRRLAKQQSKFVGILQAVSRWSVRMDVLTLVPEDGEDALVFSRQSQDLSGITWTVESFKDDVGMGTVLDGSKMALTFDKNGTVTGTANCNDLSGTFIVGDGEVNVGPIGMTKKSCSEPHRVIEQERAVIAALEAATTYWVEGDKVQMYQDDGAGVAILTHA